MADPREDRRVRARTTPHCALKVYDLASGRLLGEVGDLTIVGLRLIGDQPLEPGRRYHLRLAVPANLLGHSAHIVVDAVCGRCTLDADQNCCIAGFYDLTGEPGHIDALELLILRLNLARN